MTLPPPPPDDELARHADALRGLLPTPAQIYRRADRRRHARRAGGLLAACVAMALLLWIDPAVQTMHFATAIGERKNVSLPDGSQLVLNTGTRLDMAYSLRARRFTLHEGEAVFTVSHSPLRRFVVHTPQAQIEDIGTVFNVRSIAQKTRVSVVQGAVLVHGPAGDTRELQVGEALAVTRSAGPPQALGMPMSATADTAWREGKLVLDRMPLGELVDEIQRYRTAAIQLDDARLREIPLSGQFDIARIEGLIDLLPRLAPVRVQRRTDGSVVLEPAK
ncbi:iron dicitrate transport regulator FecR [Pigmentiphaga aceris]|uniref:Iron dicitrate transport regulator FecR n=1 Tax=Pigmentiphaga aceris TaxID=1940612 RepID=A0A5C0B3S1_9BURK|nr:FecR domain-containing protein [Pigmentiphaga aceris]QEI08584.1 iron dicitrate transport regulator FecR [Pigmentiphaga aceris]